MPYVESFHPIKSSGGLINVTYKIKQLTSVLIILHSFRINTSKLQHVPDKNNYPYMMIMQYSGLHKLRVKKSKHIYASKVFVFTKQKNNLFR